MTKKEPLISICIPTYNREKYLKRLLDSIVCQKEFIDTDDVEIVVDDGPSTDNTETMVKDYIKKYGDKIKYYRNPVRIGMCPAFLEALNFGTGKYLWLMGSDDMISSYSLKYMLKTLVLCNSKLVLCNRDGVDKKKKDPEQESIINFSGFSDFATYLGYQNKDTYHKDTYFTFISVFCIDRDYYHSSYKFLKDIVPENMLKNHYFNFSFIGYSNLRDNDIITIIDKPYLVYYGSDNKTSWTLNKKIVKDLSQEMNFLMNTYPISKNGKKTMKKIVFWRGMSLYILPTMRKICKLPILKNIYNYFSRRHIKNMGIE